MTVIVALGPSDAYFGIKNRETRACRRDSLGEVKERGCFDVIKNTKTEDDVELSPDIRAEIPNIVMTERQIFELEEFLDGTGFCDIRLSPLNCDNLGTSHCKLNRVATLKASQI
jgi:hypothetical protein